MASVGTRSTAEEAVKAETRTGGQGAWEGRGMPRRGAEANGGDLSGFY